MSISVYSTTPRVNFRGVKDEAAVNLAMPAESLPIRLPLFASFAPWGGDQKAEYVDSNALNLLYGPEVINAKSAFFTHQSLFLRTQLQAGGKALFLRIIPEDAQQASIRFAVDAVADKLPVYDRNPDGSFKLDSNGNKIDTGTTVDGYRLQLRLVQWPSGGEVDQGFGLGAQGVGTMVSADSGETSTLYPIQDFKARWKGSKGNNLGFRLIAPTVASTTKADPDLNDKLGAYVYRLAVVSRANSSSTAVLNSTLSGENYVSFTFKKGTVDLDTSTEYQANKVILKAYESKDPTKFTGYGPFEDIFTYNNHLDDLLGLLKDAEEAATGETIEDANLINFLTGVDVNGIPYHSFVVEGPAQGGTLVGEAANLFMKGGDDGSINSENYNALFDAMLDGLESSSVPFKNIARMPYDSVWDTGFPVATKLKFVNFHNLRPDVFVHVCTQDVALPLNTPSQDSSIGVTLRSTFRAQQESSEFGTKALRFACFSNAGYFIDDDYDGLVPFMEWICMKGAAYMGAENGEMNNDAVFGRGEENIITRYRDHNAGLKPIEAADSDWANGVNYAEWYDMSRLFYAGIESLYEVQTSILHSYFNTQIACNLTRIGHIVWRELSGDDRLDDNEFLDAVNDRVTKKTTGKYDGRVDITPNAYYSALDTQLDASWHLNIVMAGENIRTVENLAIIAQRRRVAEEAA